MFSGAWLPTWTAKHKRLEAAIYDPEITYNSPIMIYGPTKSSKSLGTSFFLHSWAAEMWSGYDFLLVSRTMKQANQVLLRYAEDFGAFTGLGWWSKKTYFCQESLIGPPNRFHVALGSSRRQADTVPGSSMAGLLIDEAPRMPEVFVANCISRLSSVPYSKALMTGNPEGSGHWCYKKYGCDEDGVEMGEPRHFAFTPANNPTLPSTWTQDMAAVYSGPSYDRMVLGLHVGASGPIYPNLRDGLVNDWRVFGSPLRYVVSADFAPETISQAIRWAEFTNPSGARPKRCAVGEWWYDGRERGELTEAQQAKRIAKALNPKQDVSYGVVDSSAKGFRSKLITALGVRVYPSSGGVDEGIQRVRLDLGDTMFLDRGRVPRLTSSMSGYSYDPAASERGEAIPLKDGNEHGADAARYYGWQPRPQNPRRSRVVARARRL